jgi:hypothetical protein
MKDDGDSYSLMLLIDECVPLVRDMDDQVRAREERHNYNISLYRLRLALHTFAWLVWCSISELPFPRGEKRVASLSNMYTT